MAPAPIADYLKTRTAVVKGRSGDPYPVQAFCDRPLGRVRLSVTHNDWSWRRWLVCDPNPLLAQGTRNGRLETRRVWISPQLWDSPGRCRVAGYEPYGIPAATFANNPNPTYIEIPFNRETWVTGTTPKGMVPDAGLFIDYDAASAVGWEILALRQPNFWERVGLAIRSRGRASQWDWICDNITLRTGAETLGHGGKAYGAGMRGVVRRTEIEAGVIEHALCVVDVKQNHGPPPTDGTPPAYSVEPATVVEHRDRVACPEHGGPPGAIPGVNFPNGQAFVVDLTDQQIDDHCNRLGLHGQARTTCKILCEALRTYGTETYETGCGPDPQIRTDGPLPGLTPKQSSTILDGLITTTNLHALNPSR